MGCARVTEIQLQSHAHSDQCCAAQPTHVIVSRAQKACHHINLSVTSPLSINMSHSHPPFLTHLCVCVNAHARALLTQFATRTLSRCLFLFAHHRFGFKTVALNGRSARRQRTCLARPGRFCRRLRASRTRSARRSMATRAGAQCPVCHRWRPDVTTWRCRQRCRVSVCRRHHRRV